MEKASFPTRPVLDASSVAQTLDRLAHEIRDSLPTDTPIAIIGIRRRGEVIAQRLVDALAEMGGDEIRHGSLDITLYRDDLAELGPQAILRKTEIEFDIDGVFILLVDDVIYTGRSIRAALDALIDLGRPKAIRLAVLVDRPGRELPIQPDFAGIRVEENAPVTVSLVESDRIDEVRIG